MKRRRIIMLIRLLARLRLNSGILLLPFFFFVSSLLFHSESFALINCASRPLNKGNLSTFKKEFKKALEGTELLRLSLKLRSKDENGNYILLFHKEAEYLFKNKFFPRDTVCIVTGNESPESLREASVWDTYSGTTVILAPFATKSEGDQFKSSKFDFFKYFASRVLAKQELTDHDCGDRNERHWSYYQNCIRDKLLLQVKKKHGCS